MISSPKTILFFGRSGCGKGTQAELMIQYLKSQSDAECLYIETGHELRSFAEENNQTAKQTRQIMNNGDFLPVFLPIWIWTDTLVRKMDTTKHLILDGLSRRIHEAPILDSALKFYNRKDIFVIHIDVSLDWSRTRMMERSRSDDAPEKIERRLRAFDYETSPVLEYFHDKKGYHFISINGEQSIDDVHSDIVKFVESV